MLHLPKKFNHTKVGGKILRFDVANREKIHHTKVRGKFGRINGDKIHPYKSGKQTTSQRQENFNVTSAVKVHPYKSEEESVSNAKKFRHTKVGT